MKKYFLLPILLLSVFTTLGQKIQVHVSYSTFFSTEHGSYIETYLNVNPYSINYKIDTASNKYQGAIDITMLFKNEQEIIAFEKYRLNTPLLEDTLNISTSFLDLKRFTLPNGRYNFDIIVSDANKNESAYAASEDITIFYEKDQIAFSDMEMVDHFSKANDNSSSIFIKGGHEIIPYPSNYFPPNKTDLTIYAEVYNSNHIIGEDEKLLLKYYIESDYNHVPIEAFHGVRTVKTAPIIPILQKINIESLPSGNYNMVLEIIDKSNITIATKKHFFQRNNPISTLVTFDPSTVNISNSFANKITTKDSLITLIKALNPIAQASEKPFISTKLQQYDIETLQSFLYAFWHSRNPINPAGEWEDYLERLIAVNEEFKMLNKKGYETDRGATYLKYGKPNTIIKEYYNSAAYPYEIWHYYNIANKYRNGKFVFYTHDMVVSDFTLLHSNIPGETNNRLWKVQIFSRNPFGTDIDNEGDIEELNDKYNNPY